MIKKKYVKPWVEVIEVDYGANTINDTEEGGRELEVPLISASNNNNTVWE